MYVCMYVYTVCMYVAWDSVWSLYSPDWTYRRGFVNMLDSAPAVDMVTSTGRDMYVCIYVCMYMWAYTETVCIYILNCKKLRCLCF